MPLAFKLLFISFDAINYLRSSNCLQFKRINVAICINISAEEISCVFDDNSKKFLSNLHENVCCGCSLESPRRGDSNEHLQHRFL